MNTDAQNLAAPAEAAPAAPDILLEPATTVGVEALIRVLLGRDPRDTDLVERLSKEIYAYVLRHLLIGREFGSRMFQPLALKATAHFGPFCELSPRESEVLEALFGPGPYVDAGGLTRVAEILTEPRLVAVVRRKCLSKQLDQLDEVFTQLTALMPLIRLAGAENAVAYRQTHSRRWVATLPFDRHPFTGRPLEGELVVMKPGGYRRIVPVTAADNGFEAVFEAPLVSAQPHQGFAELRIRQMSEDDIAGRYLSSRTVNFSITGDNIKGTLDSIRADIDKGAAQANLGFLDDALALVTRRVNQVPFSATALTCYIELSAATGAIAEAESFAERIPADACDEPDLAHGLMARLALSHDDLGLASSHFSAMTTPCADLAEALLRYASGLRSDDVMALLKPAPQGVLPEATDTLAGFAQAILDQLSQKPVKTGKARTELAHALVAALVRAFATTETAATIATAAAKVKLVEAKRLAAEAGDRLFAILPVLGQFAPEQLDDPALTVTTLRALTVISETGGDPAIGTGFARQVAVNSGDAAALKLAGDLLAAADDSEAAATAWEKSLALAPDAELSRRLLHLELNAVREDPTRSQTRLQTLLAVERARLVAQAESEPDNAAARLDLARIDIAAGRHGDAQALLDVLCEQSPADDDLRFERMRLAELQGDWPAVILHFERMAAPQSHEYAILLAVKACRLRGDIEASQALIARYLGIGSARLHREGVRNLFMLDQLDAAIAATADALRLHPDFADLHLLAAAIAHETGDSEKLAAEIAWLEASPERAEFDNDLAFYAYALARIRNEADALNHLNSAFAHIGAQTVIATAEPLSLDALQGSGVYPDGVTPLADGPLVSVIMTTFNAEAWVETAVRSILQQSYRNFELIIVDDGSSDSTPRLVKTLRDSDPRISLKLKPANEGTYVSKNNGLARAKGEFIAFQDSDDWSHPDRLALSVGALLAQPDLIAVQTQWVRMTGDARPVIKDDGYISHRSAISLVFRRKPVMDKIGYFDSVRVSADREYLHRLELAFGPRALGRLAWPLMFGRAHDASLTADPVLGLTRRGSLGLRRIYEENAQAFHASLADSGSIFMPYPLQDRLFPAPAELLPTG